MNDPSQSRHSVPILLLAITFRVINSVFTGMSVFNPDEYWQSMEVAYAQVWDGGYIPWEFQSHAQLRGALHPLIFTTFYSILKLFGLDNRWSVAHGPRLVEAIFAGVGEYYLYLLAQRLFGTKGARWTVSLGEWIHERAGAEEDAGI